jgi:hypothetical protein
LPHRRRLVPAHRDRDVDARVLGVKLGFIAMTGALSLVLVLHFLGDRVKQAPSFEEMIQELDWRAIFFYIALFALVGGLEKAHILDKLADALKPMFAQSYALGATVLAGDDPDRRLVEHDASSRSSTRSGPGRRGRAWPLY